MRSVQIGENIKRKTAGKSRDARKLPALKYLADGPVGQMPVPSADRNFPRVVED